MNRYTQGLILPMPYMKLLDSVQIIRLSPQNR